METLAGGLAEAIQAAPGDPLEPERIVVPHPTLGRWLTLELARRLGIAGHLKVELPAQFAWSIMRDAVPTLPPERPFAPERLRWRLFEALTSLTEGEAPSAGAKWATGALGRYLADGDPRKRFELADRLARAYDRCLLYRPEWIRQWERGKTPHWQAQLWWQLTRDESRPMHWVAAIDAFEQALAKGAPKGWPQRATFFGIDALSPSYLDVLRRAGEAIDIHLFMLSPCREYWADIAPRRVIRRRAAPLDPADEHRTEGNELLAAWGKLARDMQALLAEKELALGAPDERYDEPEGNTALARVQRDVLDLRLATEAAGQETPLAGADASLQIHLCHSAVREAEALHDRLLAIFDEQPDVQPADVLVLTPALDEYAPAIESVFTAEDAIPFNLARRQGGPTSAVQAFLDLLALPASRYEAEAVLAPLEAAAVQAKLGIDANRLTDIRQWVRDAGIRWGVDAAHRHDENLPATAAHTWRFGLRRLLLGYAIAGEDALFDEVAPCAIGFAGSPGASADYEALGRLWEYCEGVFALRQWRHLALPAPEWARKLREEAIAPFFGRPEEIPLEAAQELSAGGREGFAARRQETAAVERLVDEFLEEWLPSASTTVSRQPSNLGAPAGAKAPADDAQRDLFAPPAGTAEASIPIPFAVLRDALTAAATNAWRPVPRLADGVTVAPLATGQAFPAKVVCVVGMNDRAFPRSPTLASFDPMAAAEVRRGDRNVRDEDRLAFLEALLAARRCFLVSYTGRGLRDDAAIPPSVVLDELRHYLARRFKDVDFEFRHPLQPFSRRYFTAPSSGAGPSRLFSYSQSMLAAAQAAAGSAGDANGRLLARPPDVATPRTVDLGALVAFFRAPTKVFLQGRLDIRLETDDVALAEEEPFQLDGLRSWQLRSRIRQLSADGVAASRQAALVAAGGTVPHGMLGNIVRKDAQAAVEQLREALAEHAAAMNAPPLDIEMRINGWALTGTLENADIEAGRLLCWRIGSVRDQHLIEAWLNLLAWAASADGDATGHWGGYVGLGRHGVERAWLQAPSPAEARSELGAWLDAWRQGQCELLPFLPNASLSYASALAKGKTKDHARDEAEAKWSGNPFPDPYETLAYGDGIAFGKPYAELAETLLLPLVRATCEAPPDPMPEAPAPRGSTSSADERGNKKKPS